VVQESFGHNIVQPLGVVVMVYVAEEPVKIVLMPPPLPMHTYIHDSQLSEVRKSAANAEWVNPPVQSGSRHACCTCSMHVFADPHTSPPRPSRDSTHKVVDVIEIADSHSTTAHFFDHPITPAVSSHCRLFDQAQPSLLLLPPPPRRHLLLPPSHRHNHHCCIATILTIGAEVVAWEPG
jgi:hypothetical protein